LNKQLKDLLDECNVYLAYSKDISPIRVRQMIISAYAAGGDQLISKAKEELRK
jgi:hypothetical protein